MRARSLLNGAKNILYLKRLPGICLTIRMQLITKGLESHGLLLSWFVIIIAI